MTEYTPSERATTFRQPSTANLMINSDDGLSVLQSYNVSIQKTNAIMNGFFTRVGLTEIVLNWNVPNISTAYGNQRIIYDTSGGTPTQINLLTGGYTVAAALTQLAKKMTDASGVHGGLTWTAGLVGGLPALIPSASVYARWSEPLSELLEISSAAYALYTPTSPNYIPMTVDLRPYKFIDFTSSQLTYAQDLKDASTSALARDVICRFYFSYDSPPSLDALGFPIRMGYTAFDLRRTFSPPKQIKWEQNLPIGNLTFEVYGDDGLPATKMTGVYDEDDNDYASSSWLMTLQVSEV